MSLIDSAERVSSEVNIPEIAQGLPTDVEAIGLLEPELLTLKERPLIPGYSIGHVAENTGTLGCIATPRGGGADLFLGSGSVSVFSPIQFILDALEIELRKR